MYLKPYLQLKTIIVNTVIIMFIVKGVRVLQGTGLTL